MSHNIAIIGAGMAGVACGRALTQSGARVQLFEKARGMGGRLSTRRDGPLAFDHGAQYASARGGPFKALLAGLAAQGQAARWPAAEQDDTPRYVGMPGMADLVRGQADGLAIETGCHIQAVHLQDRHWWLSDADGGRHGPFDTVLSTAPAPQTAALFDGLTPVAARARAARLAPCLAVMAAFDTRLPLPDIVHPADDPVLAWAARNSAKPGRTAEPDQWVLHAGPDWSEALLDEPSAHSVAPLLDALARQADRPLPAPIHAVPHRWRYARVVEPVGAPCLFDPAQRLGAAGDWCLGPRVEQAFMSGQALAMMVMTALKRAS